MALNKFGRTMAGAMALGAVFAVPAAQVPAHAQAGQAVSRVEALKASKDGIVLYYGDGIRGVDQIEDILDKRGYPAEIFAGAAPGTVQLLVNKHIYGTYNQRGVDGGDLGADAITFYNEQMSMASNAPAAAVR